MRLGVLLVAVFLVLEGFTNLLLGAGMMLAKEEFYETMREDFERALKELNATHFVDLEKDFDRIYEATSFALAFIGVLYLIVAIGVFALKNWARIFAIALLVLQLVHSLATIHLGLASLLGVVISVALIWYLLRKDVKEMFSGKEMTIEEKVLGRKI